MVCPDVRMVQWVSQIDTGQGIRSAVSRTQHQSPMSSIALSALAPGDVGPDSTFEHIASSNGDITNSGVDTQV